MKNFAITGIAGFIAPRHLKAIKETGNNLVSALDPHDSVGILDSYFPNAFYFAEHERFERFLAKNKNDISYLSICSPNYLHDTHIRLALQNNITAICEKPLVLTPQNLDLLEKLERNSESKIFTIMQLRYLPTLVELKNSIAIESDKKHNVKMKYITPRGNWYHYSWKGDEEKSGGILTNIGIHLFDLLIWLFGSVINFEIINKTLKNISGTLELKNADVEWFLSIDESDIPIDLANMTKKSFRSIIVGDNEIEFSEGFTELHTKVYEEILKGSGLGIKDARPSIELVYNLRREKL
jgi:UDP-N-acetyl-2-amino-2-deoxyglucuronate dehydrogenase